MECVRGRLSLAALVLGSATLAASPSPSPVGAQSRIVTPAHAFTFGIEGVSAALDGSVFAMNLGAQGSVGRLTPDGTLAALTQLPDGGVGNGSRLGPDGKLFVADYKRHRIHRIDPDTGARALVVEVPAMHQPNDLAITDKGTLFASDPSWRKRRGRVWRIDASGTAKIVLDDLGTTNGIEISPDGRTLYVGESMQRRIAAYRLGEDEMPRERSIFDTWADEDVDGFRADAQGNLYLARNGKGEVEVVDPAGKHVRTVALAGRNPTNLAFGGVDGKTVYVTIRDKGWIEAFAVDVPGREFVQQEAWRKARSAK
jgi:sugar lactone lactonase YvrE